MDYERLIETERRNDGLLERAREEAAAIREAARIAADRRRREFEAELEAAIEATRTTVATRRAAVLAEIDAEAGAAVARFGAIDDRQVEEVARALLARLARREAPP